VLGAAAPVRADDNPALVLADRFQASPVATDALAVAVDCTGLALGLDFAALPPATRAFGAALLGFGLAGLLGAGAFVEARRRRAAAGSARPGR